MSVMPRFNHADPNMTLAFGATTVEIRGVHAITTLPSGHSVLAAPEDNDAYRATAERLGYGSDTARMCQEHEASHAWLAHVLGLQESPTLREVAVGGWPSELTNLEEQVVLALAAFANRAGVNLLDVFARHQTEK